MTIDIDEEDFGTLCICALRYCHGRRTYMPSLVQRIVMAHFKDLSDRTLNVIADDEQFQSDMNLFGDMCDKVDWKNFYQILREWKAEAKGSKRLVKGSDEETEAERLDRIDNEIEDAWARLRELTADQTACPGK